MPPPPNLSKDPRAESYANPALRYHDTVLSGAIQSSTFTLNPEQNKLVNPHAYKDEKDSKSNLAKEALPQNPGRIEELRKLRFEWGTQTGPFKGITDGVEGYELFLKMKNDIEDRYSERNLEYQRKNSAANIIPSIFKGTFGIIAFPFKFGAGVVSDTYGWIRRRVFSVRDYETTLGEGPKKVSSVISGKMPVNKVSSIGDFTKAEGIDHNQD